MKPGSLLVGSDFHGSDQTSQTFISKDFYALHPWCKIQILPAWNDQRPSDSKHSLSSFFSAGMIHYTMPFLLCWSLNCILITMKSQEVSFLASLLMRDSKYMTGTQKVGGSSPGVTTIWFEQLLDAWARPLTLHCSWGDCPLLGLINCLCPFEQKWQLMQCNGVVLFRFYWAWSTFYWFWYRSVWKTTFILCQYLRN